jgi:hypothetical protein
MGCRITPSTLHGRKGIPPFVMAFAVMIALLIIPQLLG